MVTEIQRRAYPSDFFYSKITFSFSLWVKLNFNVRLPLTQFSLELLKKDLHTHI